MNNPCSRLGITADFLADTLLVILPLLLLWKITLPKQQRRLILILFSASILTLVVSVVHAVFLIGPTYLLEGVTAEIEVSVPPGMLCFTVDSRIQL